MSNFPVFPQKICNVTQSWNGTYNHYLNSTGSPSDYPMDIAGGTTDREPFYAPCDMRCVKIYGQVTGVYGVANGAWFTSLKPCDFPDGSTDYLTIKFVHMNNDDFPGIAEGKVYKKYEYVGREGCTGNATGNHLHITAGKGQMEGSGWVKNNKSQWVLQTTGGQFKADDLLWMDTDFTQMKSEKNMAFLPLPDSSKFKQGDLVRLALDAPYYDDVGNKTGTSFDQSCVKVWSYHDGKYFICTTGWNGENTDEQEHGIGWVDESSLSEWTQRFFVGKKYKYSGGTVLHNPNGITAGDPGTFASCAVIVTDYRPCEHPYKLQSITGETLGWVSEYTIAEYSLADVTNAAKHVAGVRVLEEDLRRIYDVNTDGNVTLADVAEIAKIVAEN